MNYNSLMSTDTPKFDDPPVIETVLSAQFDPMQNFSTALVGWYWKTYLPPEWTEVREVSRLEDRHENFPDDNMFGPGVFRITSRPEPERIQIIRNDKERMIQVQNSRFVLNWRRKHGHYQSYDLLIQEFGSLYPKFVKFADEAGMETPKLNQWEVTYVNHVPKGCLWENVSDWAKVLPWFYAPESPVLPILESRSDDLRYTLGKNVGRLYVSVRHVQIENTEVLSVTLTARGPTEPSIESLCAGFSVGHEAIVRSFAALTSAEAHTLWKRRR